MSFDCCSRLGFINALAVSTYGTAAVVPSLAAAAPSPAPAARTRVVLLGTAGGPSLRPGRSSPASAVVVDGVGYVVDCGYGVGRQLVDAHIAPTALRAIVITHHHSDHTPTSATCWCSDGRPAARHRSTCTGRSRRRRPRPR